MEYYIMKKYLKAKEENEELEQGMGKFSKKTKRMVWGCLIAMFITLIAIVVSALTTDSVVWPIVWMIVYIVEVIILSRIENQDEKENLEKYSNSYEIKIDILYELLVAEYQVNSKEKLEELIALYQGVVDKKNHAEKRRNNIIITLFSAVAGFISFSVANMETIGINLTSLIGLAIILFVIVGSVALLLYSENFFDSIKRQYMAMIKDLEEMKFRKY